MDVYALRHVSGRARHGRDVTAEVRTRYIYGGRARVQCRPIYLSAINQQPAPIVAARGTPAAVASSLLRARRRHAYADTYRVHSTDSTTGGADNTLITVELRQRHARSINV